MTELPLASDAWQFTDAELSAPYIDGRESAVYVLHFSTPFHHARHYIGIALDGDIERRFRQHLSGRGSPLVYAASQAGITITITLSIIGDRGLERRMHNRHGTRVCPLCTGSGVVQQLLL